MSPCGRFQSMTEQQIVFDIGFHNGSDTAHYLARGFKVVAVEANPALAAHGRALFSDAIRDGKLLEVGIAEKAGHLDFYVNDSNS
jgi:FkbM family methyltransferase